jgi:signal transduction histidine kinase
MRKFLILILSFNVSFISVAQYNLPPAYEIKGQGTGLGLSLSYDIIKAHGGEIRVVTKENEGSEFIVQLPGNVS